MNIPYKIIVKHINSICCLCLMLAYTSCTVDNQNIQDGSGFVQFKVYKSTSEEVQKASRAANNQLECLDEAKKIKVMLSNGDFNFSQTLNLNSYNAENAEYGLRSDKLELQSGEYVVGGFYLYDKTEKQIFAGQPSERTTFTVSSGALHVQDLFADAIGGGQVKFTLTKDIVKSRVGEEKKTFPFSRVNRVDITVQNLDTRKSVTLTELEVRYKEDFRGTNDGYRTSVGEIDSLVNLPAGFYRITSYTLYDRKEFLEVNDKVKNSEFAVTDNKKSDVNIPVTLLESAENIKDYIALRNIWLKMKGEEWYYKGQGYPAGVNWSFDDKDIDMWGNQPGVVLNSEGRISSLNIGEFGAKGMVPEEIGQLTELETLALGTHNDLLGYGKGNGESALTAIKGVLTPEKLQLIRSDYMDNFVSHDIREDLSEPLKMAMELKGDYTRNPERKGVSTKDVSWGDLTNGITGVHPAIGNLKKLEALYIANAPIAELPDAEGDYDGFAGLEKLTDLEIYNCPNMKTFPTVIAKLPELIQLNMAMNKQLSSEEFKKGIKALIDRTDNAKQEQTVQILYLGYNNISELPADICKMTKLGKIDLTHNKLEILPAFGKDVNLVQGTFDYNEISSIGVDGNGLFCGMDDVESISFSNNKLTKLPNIFDVKSIYTMASVSFAYNLIDDKGLEGFEGINTANLSLAGNKLESFPAVLFQKGSPLGVLNLSGNRISKFEKGDLKGDRTYMLSTLDLTYNRLTELPSDFDGKTLPYLYGLDLSGNQLKGFPWSALNISYLTVLSLRNQRDDDGNKVLSEWPTGVFKHVGLRALFLGGNDIGKVPETERISYLINVLDISENPNIIINVSDVCPYIKAGVYTLIYDPTQDIRGCDALDLE